MGIASNPAIRNVCAPIRGSQKGGVQLMNPEMIRANQVESAIDSREPGRLSSGI